MESANTPTVTPADPPAAKPWWQSRTLWFNAACLAAAAAEPHIEQLQGVLPGGIYAWLAFVLPVGNAVLRVLTTSAVSARGGQP